MTAPSAVSPEEFRRVFDSAREAVARKIVGNAEVVEQVLVTLLAGGHCLLEGVPGTGKTLLVRTVAAALELPFSRVQFTPDLMPADILGTDLIVDQPGGGTAFEFRPGPLFASVVLADEVNRATPKTQSALLEAMEERQVTVSRETRPLPKPFFVLATQNPLEMEGTYPLPEAQLDRFLLKVLVPSPALDDLLQIVDRTTGSDTADVPVVADAAKVLGMTALAREVVLPPHLREYIGRLVLATHPNGGEGPAIVNRVVRYGASPRAAQALALGGKVRALARGRGNLSEDDIRALALPVLRHRILLNFEGEAEGVTAEDVASEVLAHVKPR